MKKVIYADWSCRKRIVEGIFFIVLVGLLTCTAGFSAAIESIELVQPVMAEGDDSIQAMPEPSEVFINRTGEVALAVDAFVGRTQSMRSNTDMGESAFKEKQLILSFFTDHEVRIFVDSESFSKNNIISLRGYQEESSLSTFTMTVSDENYLISYQDLDLGLTYKVVGNMGTGIGKVTEFDLKKLPPVYDSEPVVPPQE